jgi:hypothetical protein
MLETFQRVFGLAFRSVSNDTAALKTHEQTWHEDV